MANNGSLTQEKIVMVGRILETQTRIVLTEKISGEILEHMFICEKEGLNCSETLGRFYYRDKNKDGEDEFGSEWIFLCKNHSKGRKVVKEEILK